MEENSQAPESLDIIGVTLVSVLIGVGLSTFSVARAYLDHWVAGMVSVLSISALTAAIKTSGRDGWLQRIGQWVTGSPSDS